MFFADFHIHSHYSRATSKNLNLESLYQWAQIKGLHVIGTGDFTHPQWMEELQSKLEPDGMGLFRLKNPPQDPALPGIQCTDSEVRFCLSTEISSIYKYDGKVRKNHNLVLAPDFDVALKINARLGEIGNLVSDGRPILGLPSRDLLEIVLECSEEAHLIPAHVWTPWFSTLGSKAGYDSVEACFRDLSDHIFALETGLSSDPAMNWKLSNLDRYALVSNSDAHSPGKLGREANRFDTERSYTAMFEALKTRQGFLGTFEFFPEEGKYHLDGHRKCNVCMEPQESMRHDNVCPCCGKPLTIGVLNRVESLADRSHAQQPEGAPDFSYIIPLPEILGELHGVGPSSKKVQESYVRAISAFGNEFDLLQKVPLEEIKALSGEVLCEAIRRLRQQEVYPQGGYDGEYGTISIFKPGELTSLSGQTDFLGMIPVAPIHSSAKPAERTTVSKPVESESPTEKSKSPQASLNAEQLQAVQSAGNVLVTAGPGSGKTKTLVHWILYQIQQRKVAPGHIMAITFTNKAAEELQNRLEQEMGSAAQNILCGTFHAIAFHFLQQAESESIRSIYDRRARLEIFRLLLSEKSTAVKNSTAESLSLAYERCHENQQEPEVEQKEFFERYNLFLKEHQAVDLSALIDCANQYLSTQHALGENFQCLAVDEFQDINPAQYQFIHLLAPGKNLFVIGDPDQSIYGFRGADIRLLKQLQEEWNPQRIFLQNNYRTPPFILQAANTLIAHNSQREDLFAQAMKQSTMRIKTFAASDDRREAEYIANQVLRYVGGVDTLSSGRHQSDYDYAFSDIAVLCRTHQAAQGVIRQLRHQGIPLVFNDGNSFWDEYPLTQVKAAFQFILNPYDIVALTELVRFLEKEDAEKMDAQKKQTIRIHEYLQGQRHYRDLAQGQVWLEWIQLYEQIRPDQEQNSSLNMDLEIALQKLIDFFGKKEECSDLQLSRQETLLRLAQEYKTCPEKWMQQQILGTGNSLGNLSGGVHILTFHASKGLEFPVVFIAGAEEGITPSGHQDTDLEEERRLFYVAMTRAQQELQICHARQRTIYGTEQQRIISRFQQELDPTCLEVVALPSPRKKNPEQGVQLDLF